MDCSYCGGSGRCPNDMHVPVISDLLSFLPGECPECGSDGGPGKCSACGGSGIDRD